MLPQALVLLCGWLLFTQELMVSRLLLPAFGGGAMVWTTTVAFFQLCVLGGYGYAHQLTRLRRSAQVMTTPACCRP